MVFGNELFRAHVVHEKVIVLRRSDHLYPPSGEFYQIFDLIGGNKDFVSSLLIYPKGMARPLA
jgi:hypothetical protein